MKQLAAGVWRLAESPRPLINVYLVGDVLIDAGRRWDLNRIRRQISTRQVSLLALTHAHPDHQGWAKALCEERAIPLACHASFRRFVANLAKQNQRRARVDSLSLDG